MVIVTSARGSAAGAPEEALAGSGSTSNWPIIPFWRWSCPSAAGTQQMMA
jgi:hypothetical protein